MKKCCLLALVPLLNLVSCFEAVKFYEVTWKDEDGTILEIDTKVKEGSLPKYDGETPSKEKDEVYDYSFRSWDKEIKPIQEDITYTAVYEAKKRDAFIYASHKSGFYDEPFDLSFNVPYGFDVYYTLDNSDPNESSFLYKEPIHIEDVSSNDNIYSIKQGITSLDIYYPLDKVDKCNIVKAIAINRVSKETSSIIQLNYFIDYQNKTGYSDIPVISLNVLDEDLFDYEKGIYVTGKIYDESEHTGYPETYPANYNQKGKEWERKANFKYYSGNKKLELEQDIGIRIHGGWSRAFNQKSFNLYARKDYSGSSTFDKAFFNGIKAHSLMLRSGGYRDTTLTKIRDSMDQDLSVNESFDIQRSEPVVLFLNGEYWGIYNLQERYSDNYVSEHHNINKKNVLIIKNDEIDEGNQEDYHYYEELKQFFLNNTFDSDETYQQAQKYIDVKEFAQYMSTQLYIGNIDWPGNNVRLYKDILSSESKWHFMMYDTDDSSSILPHKCGVDIDPFIRSSHWKSGPLEEDCLLGLMLSRLVVNTTFKQLFKDTFKRIGSNNFSPSMVKRYLDKKVTLLSSPMVNNYKRFVNNEYDEEYFLNQVDIIQKFYDERYEHAIGFLEEHIK